MKNLVEVLRVGDRECLRQFIWPWIEDITLDPENEIVSVKYDIPSPVGKTGSGDDPEACRGNIGSGATISVYHHDWRRYWNAFGRSL